MQFATRSSPFIPAHNSVNRVMRQLLIALLPAVVMMFWLFGFSVLIQLLLACISALCAESSLLYLRKRPIKPHLLDLSALVSAVLLALAIPTIAPWWLSVTGSLFAIIIAKQLYGGLGHNPFNPAMAGYVFLLISFPQQMTAWQVAYSPLSLSESIQLIVLEQPLFDGLSAATLLDYSKTQLSLGRSLIEIKNSPQFGLIAGKGLELIASAYLIGGLWLLYRKVISWHIPLAVITGLSIPASLAYWVNASLFSSPLVQVFAGASLCTAFFIATDPVTAATSNQGRLIYGLLIGVLMYIIRTWGGYPDAAAFAVLLGNLAAPSIDYYLRPKPSNQP